MGGLTAASCERVCGPSTGRRSKLVVRVQTLRRLVADRATGARVPDGTSRRSRARRALYGTADDLLTYLRLRPTTDGGGFARSARVHPWRRRVRCYARRAPWPTCPTRDGPRDECGVFGIYAPRARRLPLAYFALYALQHRGQESAGIATADHGGHIITLRELGLVNQVFNEQKLRALGGDLAIGHVRYSTTGSNAWENAQPRPSLRPPRDRPRPQRQPHQRRRAARRAARAGRGVPLDLGLRDHRRAARRRIRPSGVEDAIADVMPRLQGAFSTVVMTQGPRRSPSATRPACARSSSASSATATASPASRAPSTSSAPSYCATCGRASSSRSPTAGSQTRQVVEGAREAFCVFEYIYFARPDSRMGGTSCRPRAAAWARSSPARRRRPAPTSSSPCPTPATPAARGYARASGLPQDDGLIKNRYVARTFIQPGQELRKHGLRLKFNPLPEIVGGQVARRRRRLDRARQHDAPDRADAARRGRARGAHAHLARRRSSTPATTASTCRRARR